MSAGFTLPLTTKQFQDHPAAHHDPADDQRAEAPLVHPDIGPGAQAGDAFSDPCEQTILTEGLSYSSAGRSSRSCSLNFSRTCTPGPRMNELCATALPERGKNRRGGNDGHLALLQPCAECWEF